MTSYRYGFGDGLMIVGTKDYYFSVLDIKVGTLADPWIIYSTDSMLPSDFQLDKKPYTGFPFYPGIVIDNNNFAYIYSGNALLRYKLTDSGK
jgi:hypothetical protein